MVIGRFSKFWFRSRYALAFALGLAYGIYALPARAWTEAAEARPAARHALLTATSDAFNGDYRLSLETDADSRALTLRGVSLEGTTDFPVAELARGVVLLVDSGRDIIRLQGENFDPASGGQLRMSYLSSGISNRYRTVDVAIERVGDAWFLLADDAAGRRAVTLAYFKANRVFGKVIGLESVTFR